MALTAEEQRELDELELAELEALSPEEGYNPVDTTLAALDIDRGPVVGSILALLEKAGADTKGLIKPGELEKAASLKKSFPGSAELMDRAGILKGDPLYAQTLLGLVGDVATSPSTYASFGTAPAVKTAAKVLSPVSSGVEALLKYAGKGLWKSAFSKADVGAMKAGKKLVPSDLMVRDNVYGLGTGSISNQIKKLQNGRMAERDAILDLGMAPGKTADVNNIVGPMKKRAFEIMETTDPTAFQEGLKMLDEAEKLEKMVKGTPEQIIPGKPETVIPEFYDSDTNILYRKKVIPGTPDQVIPGTPAKPLNPWRAQKDKVLSRESLPASAYSDRTGLEHETDMLKSQGYQSEAERMSVDPEKIAKLNEEWGTVEAGRKAQEGVGYRELQNPALGSGDVASGAALTLGGMNPVWWLARRAGEIGALQGPMTLAGAGMYKAGTKTAPRLVGRAIGRTPWSLMRNEDVE